MHHAGRAHNGSCWPNVIQFTVSPPRNSIHCVSPSKKLWSSIMKCNQDQSILEEQDCRVSAQYCCKLKSWLIYFAHLLLIHVSQDRIATVLLSWSAVKTKATKQKADLHFGWTCLSHDAAVCTGKDAAESSPPFQLLVSQAPGHEGKESPYFAWKLSLKAQRKDNTQNVASQCNTTRVTLCRWSLWFYIPLFAENQSQQATKVTSAGA